MDIIEPCGFVWSDRRLRRAGMDYLEAVEVTRHSSWEAFRQSLAGRLLLLTTIGRIAVSGISLRRERRADAGSRKRRRARRRFMGQPMRASKIPMRPGLRSLNVALAAAMVLGEALKQTDGFPA